MKFVMMEDSKHLSLSIRREHHEGMMHFSLLAIVTKTGKDSLVGKDSSLAKT